MSSRLVSLLGSAPFKKTGPSADFEKVNGGEGGGAGDPRFTRLKLVLALSYLVKDYSI